MKQLFQCRCDRTLGKIRVLLHHEPYHVLSDAYVDVALAGVREPRYVEIDNAISDDVESRIDTPNPHERYAQ